MHLPAPAIGLVVASLAVGPALAQTAEPAPDTAAGRPSLSLTAAVQEALAQDPTLQARRSQADADRLKPAIERSLTPPVAEFSIWQWPLTSINPADVNMYMFMFQQDFPGKGKRDVRARAAEQEARVSDAETDVRARVVVADVKRAYAELAEARRTRALYDEGLRLLREFADAADVKYGTGTIPQQDVLKAIVELSALHHDIISIEEAASLAEARLNRLLGRLPDAAVGALTERLAPSPAMADLRALLDMAREHQPELALASRMADRFTAEADVADAEKKPDVMLRGGYMLMPGTPGALTASIGLSWPNAPWSRKRLDAVVAERRAQAVAARARLQAVDADLGAAIQEAYVRYTAAARKADLLRTSILPQTAQTLAASRVAYETDRADFLTLIDTERAYLAAAIELERARGAAEVALADLERAVGTEVTMTVPADGLPPVATTTEQQP